MLLWSAGVASRNQVLWKEKDMEPLKRLQVTCVLTDDEELGIYYDLPDMFETTQSGEIWTEHWGVGRNRTLQVGNVVFFLSLEGSHESDPEYGFFARGQLVAGEANVQLCLLDSQTYGDLSAAYCLRNPSPSDLSD